MIGRLPRVRLRSPCRFPGAASMLSEPVTGGTPEEQLRRACAELSRRLRSGDDCRAEQFFDAYPSLASSAAHALELIYVEFITRRELGQNPDPAEWYARFPQWQNHLKHRLQNPLGVSDSLAADLSTVVQLSAAPGTDSAAPPSRTVLFGRYEILEPLGRGGMGVVYKARDLVLGRTVALKMIRSALLALPQEIERFYREARAAALFQHPHIVTLFDVGREGDQHYLTMAFAPGGSLIRYREHPAGDPREIVALVEKVVRAVHFAHTKGILHRDLKPGNILLDVHGEPLVSDFGLAKFTDSDAELTHPGDLVGTPAYMAPEQAARQPEAITVRTDVWSLGVLLYELLTGQRPFPGKGTEAVTRQILRTDPPPPRALRPDLDQNLETIVLRCLEKEPSRRYPSAEALADELGRWLRNEPIQSRRDGLLRRAWRTARRRPRAVAGLALLALVLIAVAVVVFGPGQSAPQRVVLLGPQGFKSQPRWLVGQGTITHVGNGVVRLETAPKSLGLLELTAEPPWERYRFRVDIQDLGSPGEVGLYITYQDLPLPQGREYWFTQYAFAERDEFLRTPESKKKQARASVAVRRYGDIQPRSASFDHYRYVDHPQFFPAERPKWRALVVDVTPDVICAFWGQDELPFATLPRKLLTDFKKDLASAKPPNPKPPPLGVRGSLGLLVDGGKALFQNASLEPLPPGE
jgi:hypothetical protein